MKEGRNMKIFIIKKRNLFLVAVILLICLITLFVMKNLSPTKEVFKDLYYQGTKEEKIVAFACNIDWGNEYIPDMLKIFKERDIKITFFPTGRWAENNEELLLKICEDGHEIGNHGYRHVDYDKLDYRNNYEEIQRAHEIISNIIGEEPKFFAPPAGAFNDSTIQAAKDLGYKTIMWSIDTIDWRQDSYRDVIVKRVLDKVHEAAIVLMHPTQETNKALPIIIDELFNRGYKIGRVSDVL